MSALTSLLDHYRNASVTEREKGTYFEELIRTYLRHEATYRDLYEQVWTYSDWAREQGLDGRDTGIDLVAKTRGTGEYHAIQCKLYAETYRVQKKDIDSFFTASGKKPFTHRIIVSTTNDWSGHANDALLDQHQTINKIDLQALEDSQIDWEKYKPDQTPVLKEKKKLKEHQVAALNATEAGLNSASRGKLIMACGTGKTFTSLKIAERLVGRGGRILFLVPSLSLLSQTLTEWTQESSTLLHSFAVCSDGDVGKKRKSEDDAVQTFTHELRYPATTEPARLASEMAKRHDADHMSVVFSTYHSIGVISRAQKDFGLSEFDLVICDEAHRTTGATFSDADESNFVRIHDADYIKASKRLYMTATPRIYGDNAKAKAEIESVELCSMDNEAMFGKELHTITFSEAVSRKLLVDYKVLVLAVEEKHVSRRLQELLNDGDNQLKVDDAAKIVGCWKALAKQGLTEDLIGDNEPMKRAVAFCQVIEPSDGKRGTHKVSSKNISSMFQSVVEAYQESEKVDEASRLICEAKHVDGSMNASEKDEKLAWLKSEASEGTCRILSNVRCLSEGVDVPALDAVLFLTPRNSQVDVVQSVGRVMRNAPGKKRGYVVLPVVIPANMEPHEALSDNKTYKVVWQVLQALRSHDDRFDGMINKVDLNGHDPRKMEVIAISDKIDKKSKRGTSVKNSDAGKGQYGIGNKKNYDVAGQMTQQGDLVYEVGEIERAIYAKIVKKCGNRSHWEEWAADIAKIANTHIDRITGILENPSYTLERAAFEAFAVELRDDLNDSITDGEIIEMLAQHLITKPVFDALFKDYSFTKHNPMSLAMQNVLDILNEHRLDKEADVLDSFYESVRQRAEGINSSEGKQKIIKELYEKFFNGAFPNLAKRLGIVYTPIQVVDFIIHSVNDILRKEFDQGLGSPGVHIIDPFTGTGTFITRLLQSGLIAPDQLLHKYQNEIHANELVLLAYYISAINIEAVYHSLAGGDYQAFEGICLADTFQMYEKDDLVDKLLVDNSARRKRQKELDIRVIIGNPPYSTGQASANDNNQNVSYAGLDGRIRGTYAARSEAVLLKGLYDSYIRAIRWASDRIGEAGVIGFVSGSGFIEKPAMDGMRKCLVEEFTNIHVINLRGDIRKNMLSKGRAKEGQNIFGTGSMTGIAITIFVKNPNATKHGEVFYHDIGDDLTDVQKLAKLEDYRSISSISSANGWVPISPDGHGDWLSQRSDDFSAYIPLGDKRDKTALTLFSNYSGGVKTNRDSWCYNASRDEMIYNMKRMISFYNDEAGRYEKVCKGLEKSQYPDVDDFANNDPVRISWNRSLKQELARFRKFEFDQSSVFPCLYRPFTKQWLYFNRRFNDMVLQMPRFFPQADAENIVISMSGVGARSGFSVTISNVVTDFHTIDTSQCFPMYVYSDSEDDATIGQGGQLGLLGEVRNDLNRSPKRVHAITDAGLEHFLSAYADESINKDDIFYYVYGLLHSQEYLTRFADNLAKEIPRIPCVKSSQDFWHFSQAGRDLAYLHLNYETVDMYPATIQGSPGGRDDYHVEKMKHGKKGKDKDLTTVIYNSKITVTGIPLEAYEYVVNGKPALSWVIDRQGVKVDKASGIVNDANDWAKGTMNNHRYPLELLLRMITVSVETVKIVSGLPRLDI